MSNRMKKELTQPDPEEIQVPPEQEGERLDRFLAKLKPELSRSRIQRLIASGDIQVNDASGKASCKLRRGDVVSFQKPEPLLPKEVLPESISLDVLYEDESLIVIDKPAGMVVHPGAGNPDHTLVNALLAHCSGLSGVGGEKRAGIVHRLDKETSGCIVAAKDDATHLALAKDFADRKVEKIYLALARGRLKESKGEISLSIMRHPLNRKKMTATPSTRGRPARTDYEVLAECKGFSLVKCVLHTGRTHQIRVHLSSLGHPLLGDKVYGKGGSITCRRQMLHAWKLGFAHPQRGEFLRFEAPIPCDFHELGVKIPASAI